MSDRAVLFDLDGTLVDSLEDLTDAVNHLLFNFDKPALDMDDVRKLIGKGAHNLVRKALATDSQEEIERGLKLFLEFNEQHIADKSRLYPGAREMLFTLSAADIRMAIVSNKNVSLSRLILKALDAEQYFSVIFGGDSCAEMKPSPLPLLQVMKQLGTTIDTTIMVGDSINDIQAGRRAGMITIGCDWGFGGPDELLEANLIATSCSELEQILMKQAE